MQMNRRTSLKSVLLGLVGPMLGLCKFKPKQKPTECVICTQVKDIETWACKTVKLVVSRSDWTPSYYHEMWVYVFSFNGQPFRQIMGCMERGRMGLYVAQGYREDELQDHVDEVLQYQNQWLGASNFLHEQGFARDLGLHRHTRTVYLGSPWPSKDIFSKSLSRKV